MVIIRRITNFFLGALAEEFFITLILPAMGAIVMAVFLGLLAHLNGWIIFGIATASGLAAPAIFVFVKAGYVLLFSEAIELSYYQRRDGWVHLHVKNNRRTQRFTASVLSIDGVEGGAEEPTYPWVAKWRGWPEDQDADLIPIGEERIIDLAKASPPRRESASISNNGNFQFFTKTVLDGLPPYRVASVGSYQDNFVKSATVRIRISTYAGSVDTPTHTAKFRIHLSFRSPTTSFTQNAVRVGIEREWR